MVTFISCNLKLLLLLPSIAVMRGIVVPPSGLVAVRWMVVSAVPFVQTPVVVFAVHCPSIITLLIRFTGALTSYVPLAIRIMAGLSAVGDTLLAKVKACESVFTGLVLPPSLPSLPDKEQ